MSWKTCKFDNDFYEIIIIILACMKDCVFDEALLSFFTFFTQYFLLEMSACQTFLVVSCNKISNLCLDEAI